MRGDSTFDPISKNPHFLAKNKGEKLYKVHFFRTLQAQNTLNQLSGSLRNASFKKPYSLAFFLVWIGPFLPQGPTA